MGWYAMKDLERRQPCEHCGRTGREKFGRYCGHCLGEYLTDLQRGLDQPANAPYRTLMRLAACGVLDVDSDELDCLLATVRMEANR